MVLLLLCMHVRAMYVLPVLLLFVCVIVDGYLLDIRDLRTSFYQCFTLEEKSI